MPRASHPISRRPRIPVTLYRRIRAATDIILSLISSVETAVDPLAHCRTHSSRMAAAWRSISARHNACSGESRPEVIIASTSG